MEFLCISCRETVSEKRHVLQCDGCARWQHRPFGIGMTSFIKPAVFLEVEANTGINTSGESVL